MKYSMNWLKRYIEFDTPHTELFERLSMTGSEVEGFKEKFEDMENVVIGKILKIEAVPDSDKIRYCSVTDGKEEYNVVCGAPNIKEGDVVPFALTGARLPGGMKIKKTKIRGLESQGMMCSKKELGMGADHTGIFILDEKYALGSDFKGYFNDIVFEIEVTPNRPDLLSHYGLAREVGALVRKKPNPVPRDEEIRGKYESPVKVEVRAPEACTRYALLYVKNVQNSPSPPEIREALESMGMTSKDLLVDISNFNLFEGGHPTHFFDADRIAGKIIIRFAAENEKCVTIDKEERTLTVSDLVIADEEKVLAIAGVIGCLGSEVTENTVNIAIESAVFTPSFIRRTKQRLGIDSDAAYRFERGVDPEAPLASLGRIVYLLKQYTKFESLGNIVDTLRSAYSHPGIIVKNETLERILSVKLEPERICEILSYLSFKCEKLINGDFRIGVPSFRAADMKHEYDVIEEVGRIYGYAQVEPKRPYIRSPAGLNPYFSFKEKVRNHFVSRGYLETLNISICDEDAFKAYGYTGDFTKVVNPLNQNLAVLAPSLFPRLIGVLVKNMKYNPSSLKLFEIGNVFGGKSETEVVSLVLYGNYFDENWASRKKTLECDLFTLKGEIAAFFDLTGNTAEFGECSEPFYTAGSACSVLLNGEKIGHFGIIEKSRIGSKRVPRSVAAAEFSLKPLFKCEDDVYTGYSVFQKASRDITMVFPAGVVSGDIMKTLKASAGRDLKSAVLFDIFEIPKGGTALTFRMTFQSSKKTLSDSDIDSAVGAVIKKLKERFNAELR